MPWEVCHFPAPRGARTFYASGSVPLFRTSRREPVSAPRKVRHFHASGSMPISCASRSEPMSRTSEACPFSVCRELCPFSHIEKRAHPAQREARHFPELMKRAPNQASGTVPLSHTSGSVPLSRASRSVPMSNASESVLVFHSSRSMPLSAHRKVRHSSHIRKRAPFRASGSAPCLVPREACRFPTPLGGRPYSRIEKRANTLLIGKHAIFSCIEKRAPFHISRSAPLQRIRKRAHPAHREARLSPRIRNRD